MATDTERTRFWADTGTTVSVYSEAEVDDLFTEAGESYTNASVIVAYTRVLGIQRLLASAAKLSDYKQNQSSESQSQVFKHLKQLLSEWQKNLASAENNSSASGSARFGGMRRSPKRIKEYPGA